MIEKPRFEVREAVSRFFSAGTHYDQQKADRFIGWLENCGYEIVPRHDVSLVPDEAHADSTDRQFVAHNW
jgi:hypothetical protein